LAARNQQGRQYTQRRDGLLRVHFDFGTLFLLDVPWWVPETKGLVRGLLADSGVFTLTE